MSYKHKCIKISCPNSYEDNDPDAYYCPSCQERNKVLAAEVDRKMKAKPHKHVKSDLELYNDLQATSGVNYRGIKAVPASQFFS